MHNFSVTENGTEREMRNTAYSLVFGSVLTLGLPLNAVSLWIFLRSHSLSSPSVVYMVNLVISDLMLVMSLPMRVYFYATGTWPLGKMACIWITMTFHNNIRSSSIFITFICVDRLLAVVYPLRSRQLRTPSKAWKAAVVIWLFVLVVNVPESVYFSRYLNQSKEYTCFHFVRPLTSPMVYLQPVLVLTMFTVNVVCTILMSTTLRRRLSESAMVSNKVNVMLIFLLNLIMFTVFFLPASVAVFFESWRNYVPSLLCLASVNCCLDPLLYYFSFDGFWKKRDVDTSV